MKDKSKNAAKTRRERENQEFGDLAKLLPLPPAITGQLDKASVVRLACSYLTLRDHFPNGFLDSNDLPVQSNWPELKELASHLMQAIDAFVFILSADGKIMYISETASVHLGMSQVELTGKTIMSFLHEDDHEYMENILRPPGPFSSSSIYETAQHFFVRMKCILAKRNAGLTDEGYKVIHCSGYLKYSQNHYDDSQLGATNVRLMAIGYTLPSNSSTEMKLHSNSFMFRATWDTKIRFVDARICDLTGYNLQELLDQSYYRLVHPDDLETLQTSHACLLMRGQVTTSYYRFLTKKGGWIWVQSRMLLIHKIPSHSQPCFVNITEVLSNVEHPSRLLSTLQLPNFASNQESVENSSVDSTTVGGYSEQFYGPNGSHLLVKRPTLPSYDRLLPPYSHSHAVTTDVHTGEQRYLLRSDLVATALSRVGVDYNNCYNSEGIEESQRVSCIRRLSATDIEEFDQLYGRHKHFREESVILPVPLRE